MVWKRSEELVKYVAAQGTLDFAPLETQKAIEVRLVNNDKFDSTLNFEIYLHDAHNLCRCFKRYLRRKFI